MAGTTEGAEKRAAQNAGVSLTEYRRLRSVGLKYCTRCKIWEPVSGFGLDPSRNDGLAAACRQSRGHHSRSAYTPRARKRGKRLVEPRDNDRKQARGRVNHLVTVGVLPRPGSLPCKDCGHIGEGRRHEYDHYLGYSPEHHEDVEAVCSKCHHHRERVLRNG